MPAFAIEILVGVASGLIVLAVQYVVDNRGQWSPSTPATTATPSTTITNTTTTITVNQIINNIHQSASKSKSRNTDEKDTDLGVYLLWGLAIVVATATFVLYYEYVVAALIGVALALALVAIRLLGHSRQITGVTENVKQSAAEVFAIVATTLVAAFGISFTSRGALSVGGTRQPVPSALSDGNGVEQFLTPIADQVKWLLGNTVANALLFAALMFAALVVVAILVFAGATTLVRWRAYLKFAAAVSMNPQSVERANKFLELTWSRVCGIAVFCVIAIVLSLGWGFDIWNLVSQQNSAPSA